MIKKNFSSIGISTSFLAAAFLVLSFLNQESHARGPKNITGVEARSVFEALSNSHVCNGHNICTAHAYRVRCVRVVANAGANEDCRYYINHPEGEIVTLNDGAAMELRYVLSEITGAEKKYTQRTRGIEVNRVYCTMDTKLDQAAIEWGNPEYSCNIRY